MTTPTPPVSPPLPVRARRLWRKYRSEGWPFQATAGLSALVMAIGAITAVHGFDSGTASTLHAQHPGGPPTTGPGHHGGHGGHHGPGGGTGGSGGSTGAGGPGTGAGGGSTGGSTGGSGSGGGSGGESTGGSGGGGLTATDRGVTATTIKVVFPVANLSGVSGAVQGGIGSSEDPKESIRAFVGDINRNGGINGRKILPEIVDYDPTDEAGMRADCQTWTKQQKVFAVIDASAWHDANQLCITQEGHTPLITSYTSTSSYLRLGAPNLWWTGPDGCHVARNLVHWAIASGKLTRTTKFGIARSTSDGDTKTYNECLAPALARAHLKARDTAVLTYTESSPNASEAEAAVTRFHAEGIKVILPMLPFFQFVSWIQAENNQGWAPPLLLSDYDFMLGIGLALVGENLQNNPSGFASPYEPQLQNQSGPSYYVYGNHDYPPYASPLGASCDKVWHKAYPQHKDDIESTGTAMTYCQNIRLFAKAATMAGKNLTRARFDTAMSHITYFPGGTVPALRFGPGRYAGPYLQRIVALHDNLDNKCPKKKDGGQQGNCWLVKSGWMQERLD